MGSQNPKICLCKVKQIIPQTKPTSIQLEEKCQDMVLTNKDLLKVNQLFMDNIRRGLAKKTHSSAIVKCFPTYVQEIPTGKEKGKCLALDLGGTNFRVLFVQFQDGKVKLESKIYVVPDHIMTGTGAQLFDHIAECIFEFVEEYNLQKEILPLGFTFSFPLEQKSLTTGILERWTKGFNCSEAIGYDMVAMLETAILKRGFENKIYTEAILNDTTGTLISCAFNNPHTKIGLIVGTGTNACYIETQKNAELFDEKDCGSGKVIINTEWGAFGDDGCLDFVRTSYDKEIDSNCINPGKQIFEKMISGMYMGELVRLPLEKFTKAGLFFGGQGSNDLFTRDRFYSNYLSEIESDPPGTFTKCMGVLKELGLGHATREDCVNVRYLCECVSRRAAYLVSATLCALMTKMGEKRVTIGIDGSVYRYHPHFHNLLMEKIGALVDHGIHYDLMLSEDGSGKGAALIAAVAAKQKGHI